MLKDDLAIFLADDIGIIAQIDFPFTFVAQHIGAFAADCVREDKADGRRVFWNFRRPTVSV